MNSKDNNILQQLPQSSPPDLVWDKIEKALDKEEKRRIVPIWWRYAGAAAAAAVLIFAGYGWFKPADKSLPVMAVNTPDRSLASAATDTGGNKTGSLQSENTGIIQGLISSDSFSAGTYAIEYNIKEAGKYELQQQTAVSEPFVYEWTFGGGSGSGSGYGYGSGAGSGIVHSYTAPLTTSWNAGIAGGAYTIITGRNGNSTETRNYAVSDNIGFKGDVDSDGDAVPDYYENEVNAPPGGLVNLEGIEIKDANGRFDSIRLSWGYVAPEPQDNTESYAPLIENEYQSPFKEPLSTFSIDVDNASYANTRRMIQSGSMPPKDAVRIEECINYFTYNYPQPKDNTPFSINLETASCPWNTETRLVQIGLQGKDIDRQNLPASNLVFLIDVSGSMEEENKLPLVKKSLKLLADQMRPQDRIAVVTYAGAAGLALKSTACSEKDIIKEAIDNLDAGGSTAGGQGIELAYKVASENLKQDGNNRIILVTDGDFNVGLQSDEQMKNLIEEKRKQGIFLTVCGFGMGNLKDSKMEILADHGNGNYYYIDNYKESNKVFSKGLTGTLFTIAKDVKIQVEFNPRQVKAYRLIGYENRKLEAQDFADDTKDAGELGAGHTVTALYEIIPAGSNAEVPGFIELKYQGSDQEIKDYGNEMLTVKLRYKEPGEDQSKLLEQTLDANTNTYRQASHNFRYASAVTMYGMLLRDSKFKGNSSYEAAKALLKTADLNMENGYRDELLELIDKAEAMSKPR